MTVSEIFPLEVRAKAIAVFVAIAQCFGSLGSHPYGHLIGTGNDPNPLYWWGYLLGAGAMILGVVVAAFLAVDAEGKSWKASPRRCRWWPSPPKPSSAPAPTAT